MARPAAGTKAASALVHRQAPLWLWRRLPGAHAGAERYLQLMSAAVLAVGSKHHVLMGLFALTCPV